MTTNSTIERKAREAESVMRSSHHKNHKVCYVIDGAGNINIRKNAVSTLCNYSDCTVAMSESEIKLLADYIKEISNKDPKEVVIDEVIGQSIPICLYEIAHGTNKDSKEAILFYIYIFILFRFFDIKKPFPINFFDRKFKNSFGVIIDDVIAGFYVVLTLIIFMVVKSKLFIWT